MMSVFEDLIVELKAENLLEGSVSEPDPEQDFSEEELHETQAPGLHEFSSEEPGLGLGLDDPMNDPAYIAALAVAAERIDELENTQTPDREPDHLEADEPKKHRKDEAFFQKRAVDEVSSLQMVEHVLTGVEREHMKIVPKVFDDLNAKKALHAFVQIAENVNSEEHAQAEFLLMQETESWCSALALRDRDISVANVRRYCENSRPALSSQALLALGRFYRNLPYSETVRGKFDFIITRLFTRPTASETRMLLFTPDEMLGHIKTLYADWSSIPLYAADDDDSNIKLTALSFEELTLEAEGADSFDALIESDFFGRLRLFKESIAELFFAPIVTAAAIECNLRIGNAYVDLIDRERNKMDAASIQSKYGDLNDQTIAEAASRTLDLADLLREKAHSDEIDLEEADDFEVEVEEQTVAAVTPSYKTTFSEEPSAIGRVFRKSFGVNKWLLVVGFLLISASVGLYVWANYFVTENVSTVGVKRVELDPALTKDYVRSAKISDDTLYVILLPAWETMPKEKQRDFLIKVYQCGPEKGFVNVSFVGSDGKVAGYASPSTLELSTTP